MKVRTSAARLCAAALLSLTVLAARANAQIISSGTITANNGVQTVPMVNLPVLGVDLTGTWAATANFYEAGVEDCSGTLKVIPAFRTSDQTTVTTATANNLFSIPNLGYRFVCVKASPFTSGTITVTFLRGLQTPPANVSVGGVTIGEVVVTGTKSQNTAAPGATNIGALIGIANDAAPTLTEGNQVGASFDLSGGLRVSGIVSNGSTATDNSAVPSGTVNGVSIGQTYLYNSGTTQWNRLQFGQQTMAQSLPVTIASNQGNVPTTIQNSPTVLPGNTANTTAWFVTPFSGSTMAGGAGSVTSSTPRFTLGTDDSLFLRIGEVQATPTLNTLLGRIKAMQDQLTNVVNSLNALDDAVFNGNGLNLSGIGGVAPGTPFTPDMDTGAGTVTREAIGIAVAASGGPVQVTGDTANGLDVDVTRLPAVTGNVAPIAATSGGCVPGKLISAASTNATSVTATPTQIYALQILNFNAAARYFKIYDKASAPTVGTDVPLQALGIPPNSTTGGGFVLPIPVGMQLSNGFAFALTTGAADGDTGAVAAGEIVVNYCRK